MAKSVKVKKIKEHKEDTPSSKIFWAFMYLLLIVVVLVSACFIFDRTYYTPFYVVGRSMAPTLNAAETTNGGYYEYGIVDEHQMAKKSLKRYDLVITYYNEDYEDDEKLESDDIVAPQAFKPVYANKTGLKPNSGAKIKRVIGMPNETVIISNALDNSKNKINTIEILDETIQPEKFLLELPFTPLDKFGLARSVAEHNNKTTQDIGDSYEITLGEDEYFVMGDNWGHSDDSTSLNVGPVKADFISGIVIKIEGKVKIEGNKVTERVEYEKEDIRYYKQ